ncbi:MAG: pilin [Candidatus Paceibacterota bacterium]|jgi:peptidoglycan biosynthesis protein MviN/MurJ (putative lipid II flippase)
MNKKIYITISSLALVCLPLFAFAQQKKDLNYLISLFTDYLNKILLVMMGVAVVLFVYYIIKFFLRPSDKREEGAKYLMWSIIGFFIILSFWGVVNVLKNTFNLDSERPASWSDFFNIFPRNTNSGGTTLTR